MGVTVCGDGAANSTGLPVLVNVSAVGGDGMRTAHATIKQTNTREQRTSAAVPLLKGETEFELRILVDRCIVEAFLMGGRAAFTSSGPATAAGAPPGTAVKVFSATGVRLAAATVYSMGCGWTNPPTIGVGPFTHDE